MSQTNAFDQFDQQEDQGNAFDQFDSHAAEEKSHVAKQDRSFSLSHMVGEIGKGKNPLMVLASETAKSLRPDNDFFNTLKEPENLWKEESLPAHLYSAAAKGTFNKPLKELVSNVRDDIKDFSLPHLWDAAKERPGVFFGELVNSIVADPELMLAPMGLGGKLANSLERFGSLAKVGGRVAETGIAGGVIETPVSIAEQLDKKGVVSMQQLMSDVGTGAAFSAALGTGIHLASDLAGLKPKELFMKMKEKMQGKRGADVAADALDDVLGDLNIPEETKGTIMETMREHADIEKTNKVRDKEQKQSDDQIKKMTKGFSEAASPEEKTPEVTPSQAKSDLGKMAAELKSKRVAQEKIETDFSKMTERLQLDEADRIASLEKLETAKKEAIKQSFDNMVNPEKTRLPEAVIVGSADAARLKPEFLRSADDLVALQREKIAVDGAETPTIWKPVNMKEQGFADPKMLKWLALAGMGSAAGGYFSDDKAEGAVIGAALAVGGGLALKAAGKVLSKIDDALEKVSIGPRDKRIRIDDMREEYQRTLSEHALSGMKAENMFKRLVPDETRRSELTHYIQNGKASIAPRTREESLYVDKMKKGYEDILRREQAAEVIEDGIEDGSYVAQFWKGGNEEILKAQQVFSAMSKKNPHAMQRVIPSYEVGINAGLEPKTLDSAEIFRMRLENSGKAIGRKKLFNALKEAKTPDGDPLLARMGEDNTAGYASVPHPSLDGYKIHPDIAPSLGLLYSHLTPNSLLEGLQTVNSAMNRTSLSLSLFHPMSLFQALTGTTRFLRSGPQSWKFLEKAHDAWMLKGSEELLHDAIVDGRVKIEAKKGVDVEYDKLQGVMNKVIEKSEGWFSPGRAALAGAGAAYGLYETGDPLGAVAGAAAGFVGGRATVRALQATDKMLQKFLWDYLHPVFKLATFGAEQERAHLENTARAARGEPVLSKREIAKNVGSAVNDIYGGIQWQDIAEGVQNKYGRNMAIALAQPDTQRLLSIALRAPDWIASTTRSIVKAFPGVTKKEISQIHRSYMLNSLLMYAVMGDGLNMYFSGHHLWENKDKTRIDLGDGRTMQTNKHLMEFFHLVSSPGQALLSKLSPLLGEAGAQMLGTEFLAPRGKMIPMQEGRVEHLAKSVLPIPAKGENVEQIISSLIGMPIYGRTKTETEDRKRERARKRTQTISKLMETGMTRKEANEALKERGL